MTENVVSLPTNLCPSGLCPEARQLWREIIADYQIDDAAGLSILRGLCETLGRLRDVQAQIQKDGLTVPGYNNQVRPHPLLKTEAELNRLMLAQYRALRLDPDPGH